MVRILLTSDIHLGAEIEESPVPDNARLKTFKKLTYLAKSHDLFLIAGDLFHKSGINEKTIDFVKEEFNNLMDYGVEVIYVLGDQELSKEENISFLSSLRVSKFFSDKEIISSYKFSKNNQTIFIYGIPAYSKVNISEINKISDTGFHIGLFHTDFYFHEEKFEQIRENTSEMSRIEKRDIIASDLDFYALGHCHQFKLFKSNAKYIGAYPGSPEAVTFDETGDRYALSIIVKDDEIYQIKRLTVNSTQLEHIDFDCSEVDPISILQTIKENEFSYKILKILLTGKRNFKLDQYGIITAHKAEDQEVIPLTLLRHFDKPSAMQAQGKSGLGYFPFSKQMHGINNADKEYQRIYIEDKSCPGINIFIDEFAGEESIRGEFFNILNEKIRNNECPDIDMNILSEILYTVIYSGAFTLEDLCRY